MTAESLNLKSLVNCRDLGTITNRYGHKIRSGKLIRSNELHNASKADLMLLHNHYGVSRIIDLRSSTEALQRPDKLCENMELITLPILPERAAGVTRDEESERQLQKQQQSDDPVENAKNMMKHFYHVMVSNPFCLSQYRRFVELLLENHENASLWHCYMGKDRAGIAAVIAEMILDVDEDTIIADYLYTNKCHFDRLYPEYNYFDAINFAWKDYLFEALQTIANQYGNNSEFLINGLGLTKIQLDQFKHYFLE